MSDDKNWPAWRYGPKGEAQIFDKEKDVPKGWLKHPDDHKKSEEKPPKPGKQTAPKKSDEPEKAEQSDEPEKAEQSDEPEKAEKAEQSDEPEKAEQTGEPGHLDL